MNALKYASEIQQAFFSSVMKFNLICNKFKLFWVLEQISASQYECTWATNENRRVLFIVGTEFFYTLPKLESWKQIIPLNVPHGD
jgi:hypothetical protein